MSLFNPTTFFISFVAYIVYLVHNTGLNNWLNEISLVATTFSGVTALLEVTNSSAMTTSLAIFFSPSTCVGCAYTSGSYARSTCTRNVYIKSTCIKDVGIGSIFARSA